MAGSEEDFDDYDDYDEGASQPLDDRETALVRQDLVDLESFQRTFEVDGYRGVSIYCHDCAEEHYYPWDMLRENLETLLETGETPVHEPAFAPESEKYVPWEYARGYVDALGDVGVTERRPLERCPRCRYELRGDVSKANFCPRCGTALLPSRLLAALEARGVSGDDAEAILRESGLPG